MQRLYAKDIKFNTIKQLVIDAQPEISIASIEGPPTLQIVIQTEALYSFLYVDDINDVGTKKERIVRGRVVDIYKKDTDNTNYRTPFPDSTYYGDHANMHKNKPMNLNNTFVKVDCSMDYVSHTENLKLTNILGVNSIDYQYELETPKIVPADESLKICEKTEPVPYYVYERFQDYPNNELLTMEVKHHYE